MSIIQPPYTGYPDYQKDAYDGPVIVNTGDVDPDSLPNPMGPFYVGGWWGVTINLSYGEVGFNPQVTLTWYADQATTIQLAQTNLVLYLDQKVVYNGVVIPSRGPWLTVVATGTD
jgi:hypothetical protein